MSPLRRFRTPLVVALLGVTFTAAAQPPGPPPPPPPRAARDAAQVDLTGYWVAQITEDWRWRMITPPKGDYTSVPLTALGRQVADSWDPARDTAAGEQCRAFGAGGIMRLPTRLKIEWVDESTLRIETDAGEQVRLLHFAAPPPAAAPSWQGRSVAAWTREPPPGNPFGPPLVAPTREASSARAGGAAPPGAPRAAATPPPPDGGLKVVTANLRPGYLRKNGVPYSGDAVVTEYFDRSTLFGNDYLQVQTIVTDPAYLATPFVVSNHFKREPDGAKWQPTPCATAAPLGAFQAPIFVQ
jgi:hypothetical protein